jgi:hypothetical protein
MGQRQASRIADDDFNGSFLSCLDITFKELDEAFKAYSKLNVAQGQIRVPSGTRKNIEAFLHWTRDEIRLARDPGLTAFPVNQVDLICWYKTHERFQVNSKTLAKAAKPEKFKAATKWEDWKPTFLNYLRSIPGRDGIPLKYIRRETDTPNPIVTNANFLDNYVTMAPLEGDSFAIDTAQLHTLLVNFIAGNDTAKAKINGSNE